MGTRSRLVKVKTVGGNTAKALVLAVCLVGIHVYFGIQVLARNVIFVDLALAQIREQHRQFDGRARDELDRIGAEPDFEQLPAGEYTLEAWHEKFGTQTLKVKAGARADFLFKE